MTVQNRGEMAVAMVAQEMLGQVWGDGREDSGMSDSNERWWGDSSVRQ